MIFYQHRRFWEYCFFHLVRQCWGIFDIWVNLQFVPVVLFPISQNRKSQPCSPPPLLVIVMVNFNTAAFTGGGSLMSVSPAVWVKKKPKPNKVLLLKPSVALATDSGELGWRTGAQLQLATRLPATALVHGCSSCFSGFLKRGKQQQQK